MSAAKPNLTLWKIPQIPPIPAQVLLALAKAAAPGLLGALIRSLKYIFFLLLLANARSLPLLWHVRVFRPAIYYHICFYLQRLRGLFYSKQEKTKSMRDWAESLCPVGENPFEMASVFNTWTSFDDGDFNAHLSNSSYAKTLDAARFKAGAAWFPTFFRSGGWMPLAATHYHFIREIPMFASYHVRVSIAGWDNKWIYLICRFLSKPSKKTHRKVKKSKTPSPQSDSDNDTDRMQISMHTPVEPLNITPSVTPTKQGITSTPTPTDTATRLKALRSTEEPDGATLHCISISTMCFKHGRITIPPAVILASEGFTRAPPKDTGLTSYSKVNPPPNWKDSQALRVGPNGSMRKFREFLKAGWKEVPAAERWWDEALGGEIEERRKAGVAVFDLTRKGLEGARELR